MKSLLNVVRRLCSGQGLRRISVDEAYCPFGEDFGLAIIPDFVQINEAIKLKNGYFDLYSRNAERMTMNDGRLELPPLATQYFDPLLTRMEESGIVPPDWFNHQTVQLYRPGDFVRAHVDNLFLYDDIFATFSVGSNALLRFVHIQHGEELDVMVPNNSLYILSGPARYVYFHMVLPVEVQRLAVTLRRCIIPSEYTFRPAAGPLASLMGYRALRLLNVLQSKQIGNVRIAVAVDDVLTQMKVDAFDTAAWVQRLKPLNDWSLSRQLDEDAARLHELRQSGDIEENLDWRLQELRTYFTAIEAALIAAPSPNVTHDSSAKREEQSPPAQHTSH